MQCRENTAPPGRNAAVDARPALVSDEDGCARLSFFGQIAGFTRLARDRPDMLPGLEAPMAEFIVNVPRVWPPKARTGARCPRSPVAANGIVIEYGFFADELEIFRLRLCDEHPIEWIAMLDRQLTGTLRMLDRNR
jgi:hypothetical protein